MVQFQKFDSLKPLGIFLSNDCIWHKHIKFLAEKIMVKNKFYEETEI